MRRCKCRPLLPVLKGTGFTTQVAPFTGGVGKVDATAGTHAAQPQVRLDDTTRPVSESVVLCVLFMPYILHSLHSFIAFPIGRNTTFPS